ncbi:MAG: diguanylate cyclase [Spirochaetota bacterium]
MVVLTLDIGTLYVAASVVAGFLGVAFLAFHAIGITIRGVLQWAIGYLLIAAGLTVVLFRGPVPLWLYGPASNFFFILGALMMHGSTRTEDETVFDRWNVAILAVSLGLLLAFTYVVPNASARLEVLFVAVAFSATRTSVQLIRESVSGEEGLRTALGIFATFYVVLAVTFVALAIVAVFGLPIHDILDRHPMHAILLPGLMLFFIGAGMSKLWVHYMRAYAEAHRAATIDPLTNVRNRRYLMPEFERLFQRALRENERLACLMLDADTFKSVNDTYGHRKGDDVLQELARRITAVVRDYDLVGRYGGEEFIVIVPEREADEVIRMAKRIHDSIRTRPLAGVELTVSLGVAFLSDTDEGTDDLIQRADRALYRAKREGRDRIAVEDTSD